MSLCPEADLRYAMSDAEFWEHVADSLTGARHEPRYDDEAYMPTPDEPTYTITPCPVCGSFLSACGYDDEGRPMIHATQQEDE